MITYASGGLLGDFIHQLSVVQENFLSTGRKGCVYLSNHSEPFRFGIERAYADLWEVVSSQDYVESFHVRAYERFDVDLSAWRQSPLPYKANWRTIFEGTYQVPWGAHKWLTLPAADEYQNTILIGLTARRPPTVDWEFLHRLPGAILFAADNQEELDVWQAATRSNLPTKVFPSLYELYRAIHGCKLFIGSLSSPLAAAMAAHRPCIGLVCRPIDGAHLPHVAGLEKLLPYFQLADREPTDAMLERALGTSP